MWTPKRRTQPNNTRVKIYYISLITCFAIIILSIWGILNTFYDSTIPMKKEWIQQQSNIWLNWIKPCHYHRFLSNEKGLSVTSWFVKEFRQTASWNQTLITKSTNLVKKIKLQMPNHSTESLNQYAMDWSTPVLGSNYALNIDHPFFLLIHTRIESSRSNRVAHIRIFDTPEGGSLIEIWDNRSSSH